MTGNGQPREPALCQLYRHTFVPSSGSSVSECSSFMFAWEWREDETTVVCWLEVLKIRSQHTNWTEVNWTPAWTAALEYTRPELAEHQAS